MQAIFSCRHPVIAQIKGCASAAGRAHHHVRPAHLRRWRALRHPRQAPGPRGVSPELKPLLDLIGPANALEVLLEGQIHSADDALRMGLVNRVVADDEVEHEVFATAMRIAEGAPLVARWHKKFTRRLMRPEPLSDEEMDESFHCFETEDFRAGYQAFLAKANPEFRGR